VLARRELREGRRRRGVARAHLCELGEQSARDRRRQQRLARGDDAHAVGELLGRDILQQEPRGSGTQRLVDVLVEVERREHEDLRSLLTAIGDDPPRRLDAADPGQVDVH
jgi:hypothetical protein